MELTPRPGRHGQSQEFALRFSGNEKEMLLEMLRQAATAAGRAARYNIPPRPPALTYTNTASRIVSLPAGGESAVITNNDRWVLLRAATVTAAIAQSDESRNAHMAVATALNWPPTAESRAAAVTGAEPCATGSVGADSGGGQARPGIPESGVPLPDGVLNEVSIDSIE